MGPADGLLACLSMTRVCVVGSDAERAIRPGRPAWGQSEIDDGRGPARVGRGRGRSYTPRRRRRARSPISFTSTYLWIPACRSIEGGGGFSNGARNSPRLPAAAASVDRCCRSLCEPIGRWGASLSELGCMGDCAKVQAQASAVDLTCAFGGTLGELGSRHRRERGRRLRSSEELSPVQVVDGTGHVASIHRPCWRVGWDWAWARACFCVSRVAFDLHRCDRSWGSPSRLWPSTLDRNRSNALLASGGGQPPPAKTTIHWPKLLTRTHTSSHRNGIPFAALVRKAIRIDRIDPNLTQQPAHPPKQINQHRPDLSLSNARNHPSPSPWGRRRSSWLLLAGTPPRPPRPRPARRRPRRPPRPPMRTTR